MRSINITEGTIFPKLRNIIQSDIEFLDDMLSAHKPEDDVYDLIDSLKDAKLNIMELIPGDIDGTERVPSPPDQNQIAAYDMHNSGEIKDRSKLVDMFYTLEKDQMEYIKDVQKSDEIPDSLSSQLSKILNIYITINDQLLRSKMTQRFDRIVI